MSNYKQSPLRLNVGFLINQNVGSSREFHIDLPQVHLAPDLDLEALAGTVRITRTPQGLLVQANMTAALPVSCVRCLKEFQQSLKTEFTELYAFSARSVTDSDLILPDDYHIDLAPLIREYMLLEIPISPFCKPDCKGLCPVCGENLNQTQCDHRTDTGDPRLAILKELLDKD